MTPPDWPLELDLHDAAYDAELAEDEANSLPAAADAPFPLPEFSPFTEGGGDAQSAVAINTDSPWATRSIDAATGAQPIPEPSSLALLAAPLAAMFAWRMR